MTPAREAGHAAGRGDTGTITEQVVALWREVLGIDDLDPLDSLFLLGGDSLTATKLLARAHRLFGVELALDVFLGEPTVRHMARLVASATQTTEVSSDNGLLL